MDDLQCKTAKAIVNVFETGRVRGHYGSVTLIPGDKGHLTYGRSQTTLASGNLYLLIRAYCNEPSAAFANELRTYEPRLLAKDLSLDTDAALRDVLRRAGDDPVMQQQQDRFFDAHYFEPARRSAANRGLQTALGQTVVYDSIVHGSFALISSRVGGSVGAGMTEQQWVTTYLARRRDWLSQQKDPLPRTVYRMDALKTLADAGKWELPLPIEVHGVTITEAALSAAAPPPVVRASAQDDDEMTTRVLVLTTPYMRGPDVVRVQQALDANGGVNGTLVNGVKVYDGVYGPFTELLVRKFQRTKDLQPADGIVGPMTRTALGL